MITMDLILEDQIKQYMKEEDLKPGDRLPGERFHCDYFSVQRPTLRTSLQRLKNEGILNVKKNSGYYMAGPRIPVTLGSPVSRFDTRQTESCCTQLLNVLETEFDSSVMNKFPFSDNNGYSVIGLQTRNFIPYGMITSLIPAAVIPGLTILELRGRTLFDVYRARGQEIAEGQERIGCRKATAAEAAILGVEAGENMVSHSVYGYNDRGQCVLIQKISYIQESIEFGGW